MVGEVLGLWLSRSNDVPVTVRYVRGRRQCTFLRVVTTWVPVCVLTRQTVVCVYPRV